MGTQLSALKVARTEAIERGGFAHIETAEASVLRQEEKRGNEKNREPSAFQVCSRLVRGSIHKDYDVSCRVVGQGASGLLYAARSRLTGRECCVKFFQKAGACRPSRTAILKIRNEVNVRVRVDHPNIARLIEIYEDEKQLALVLEYCPGGDLFSHLCDRGRFPEQTARVIVQQMLAVLCYLHAHDVVHRDLRLEKWVLATQHDGSGFPFLAGPVKLVDLGNATVWSNKSKKMDVACGALAYASPDMLVGRYTQACDLWSLGVIAYRLLSGHSPFHGRQQALVSQILSGAYTTNTLGWKGVSKEARDFVERLMDVDPVRRMTVNEALNHVWIASLESKNDVPLSLDFLTAVEKFARCSKLRRANLTMMAYSVTSEAAGGLDKLFFAFCKSPKATLGLDEFISAMKTQFPFLDIGQVVRLFQAMDSSCENEISYNDFLAVMLKPQLEKEEFLLLHTLRKWDADHSGFISLDDLRVLLGDRYSNDALEDMMHDCDINGDGHIDFDEFIEAVRNEDDFESDSRDGYADFLASPAAGRRVAIDKELKW
ncbi:calcium-dependent protein kinase CDPK4A [Toxoplasma gondii RUB]|uniref:Calcium-dependent protein kinase CDPK4A n=3 Tax=Toxoplasma gondii TaxID=5811 RepID=A0A2G8XS71_TOXGO|nr:calcium-dependent protein kinase CDPK4A [Toxoplasma gondii RUB]KFH00395.1 calcium-dependent protein kinase CDPK4A [Toxoplasma gondii VAND]PIL97869.1 calcium-dependent protein kinase CDPK4A [Toxoplasma gondii COUG]